jgi:hypothetical protein
MRSSDNDSQKTGGKKSKAIDTKRRGRQRKLIKKVKIKIKMLPVRM